jgi:prevent-host-death family protein
MEEVGVRELKIHASEIVRKVREERVRYTITYRGKPVGVLMPVDEAGDLPPEAQPDPWAELERLGEEIGRGWQSEKTSAELISEMRR